MKRTALLLDEGLLRQTTNVFGAKNYSTAVNLALAEVLGVRKVQSLSHFFGRGL